MVLKDLRERTIRGGFAKLCAQGANFSLRIGSLMVLARLLDPKDFGLVGMATAFTGAVSLFKDAGLSIVTVQRPTITNEEVSTLFWLNLLLGLTLAMLSLAMAPMLVMFYHEPALLEVTAVLAAGFVFNGAGIQHSALLEREMRFGTLSVVEIASQMVSTGVGIGMALGGYGYWSLVAMIVLQSAVATAMCWSAKAWVPGLPHFGGEIGSMIRFGGTATLNSLITYISSNLEKVLLGRFWGAETLGIYGRAFTLINIPTENLNAATGSVLFSALSRLQNDPGRFKNYFLKSYSLMLSLTVPTTIACAIFADDLVFLALGPKWKDAVIIFRLLVPTILVFALINPMYWLMVSLGMAGRSLKMAIVLAPLLITVYILGLPYGPTGVAFGYSVVMMLWLVPCLAWCLYGTMIPLRDLLCVLTQPFLSAIVAAAITFIVQSLYGQTLALLPRLMLGGGVLLLVYLWMLLYVMGQKEFYVETLRGLKGWPSPTKALS